MTLPPDDTERAPEPEVEVPVNTDNTPRPEDGPQDAPQDPGAAVASDDDWYPED